MNFGRHSEGLERVLVLAEPSASSPRPKSDLAACRPEGRGSVNNAHWRTMNAPLNASDVPAAVGADGGQPAEGSTPPVSGVPTVDLFPCPFCGRLPEVENLGGFLCVLHDESECPLTARGWGVEVWNNRAINDGQYHAVPLPVLPYFRLPHRDEHGHCDEPEVRPDRMEDYR